jgi:phenylalanyl-tRNA synthetase beta chain
MKASFNWLSEFVEIDLAPEDLADRLTMAGLEVEGCSRLGEGLKGVVVGKIVSLTPHPQADQLVLCQVDIGSEVVSIVCGAANIRSSQYVPGESPQ